MVALFVTNVPFFRILQRHNSPAGWAGELFKLSTDSTSLLAEIEKNFFLFWFSGGDVKMMACFAIFGRVYLDLGANPLSHFLAQVLLETRLWSASLEPSIGFPACLEPKLGPTNPNFDKNQNVSQKV